MSQQNDLEEFQYQLQAQQALGQQSELAQQQTSDQAQGTFVDPNDGTVYEWDSERRGWFPKIDNDFIASYQASYGIASDDTTPAAGSGGVSTDLSTATTLTVTASKASKKREGEKEAEGPSKEKKRKQQEPGWFDIDDDHNTSVYVSNLPLDITEEEFITLMKKCGIIMEEEDGSLKIKLYKTPTGEQKGDGLCCYLKVESVKLALQLLDQSMFKGKKISVERAKFQLRGEYDPSLKKKKNQKKKKKGKKQEKQLDWRERRLKEDGKAANKWDKVIIFKNLFNPQEFEEDPVAITDIRDDLRTECEKLGVVKKVLIFDRHPEGVASVAFRDFEAADQCVAAMNGRWFGGKQLEVFKWDGITNYQVEETSKERDQRLQQWQQYIIGQPVEDKDTATSGTS